MSNSGTFIGQLPETVEEFQVLIHDLFPLILDTKYLDLASRGGSESMRPNLPLKDLCQSLQDHPSPLIACHKEHTQYIGKYNKDHEAGYDSRLHLRVVKMEADWEGWMTAQVVIKLSAKIYADKTHVSTRGESSQASFEYVSAEEEIASKNGSRSTSPCDFKNLARGMCMSKQGPQRH